MAKCAYSEQRTVPLAVSCAFSHSCPIRGTPRHTCRIASSVQPNDPRDNWELSTVKSHNQSTQTSETPSHHLPAPNQSPRLLDFTSEITCNHHPIFSVFAQPLLCSLGYCCGLLTTTAHYSTLSSVLGEQHFSNTVLIMTLPYTGHLN